MMSTRRTTIALNFLALLAFAHAITAMAAPAVIFETGGNTPISLEKTIHVESALIQIKLSESIVLSATRGAEFRLEQPDQEHYRLHMGKGDALIADMYSQQTFQLGAGLWMIPANQHAASALLARDEIDVGKHNESAYRQGFHFNDYVMVRQQDYLNSLNISGTALNNWLANFLGYFVGPPRQ